jgi:ATP/maltotriose-dependent transcriptional regulator MalT
MQDLLLAVIHHKWRGFNAPESSIRAYAADLIEVCSSSGSSRRVSHPALDREGLVKGLTAREMEVLNLLAEGDSNRTIAAKLVITVRAVKKHTGNIYRKLNVHSRTQAVARARQLGLLATQR